MLGACLDQLEPMPVGANLGIVYLSEALAPMADDIVRALRERTGVLEWLGACGGAVLGGPAGASDDGLAVLVTRMPEDSFRIVPSRMAMPTQIGLLLAHAELGEAPPPMILADLARHDARTVVGGLIAAARSPVQIAETVMGGSPVCIGFRDDLPVLGGMAAAGTPMGPLHRVTSALGSDVLALDGRPALEVMADEMGDLFRRAGGRFAGNLWLAEPSGSAPALEALRMRWIAGIDADRGALRLEGGRPGAEVRLMRPDPAGSRARVRELGRSLAGRLSGRPAKAGLYLASRHRGRRLFGPAANEIAWLREELGSVPLIGLVTDAEIFDGVVHEAAGVLVLFG